jgi:hypothetical protein
MLLRLILAVLKRFFVFFVPFRRPSVKPLCKNIRSAIRAVSQIVHPSACQTAQNIGALA